MKSTGPIKSLSAQGLLPWIAISILAGLIVGVALCAFSWSCRHIVYAFSSGVAVAYVGDDPERVVISRSPLRVADYYAASGDLPLIVLVHGSDPKGRRSAFSRLLAHRLRALGFPVIAIDLQGFGESDDPSLPLSEDFQFEDDVSAATSFALQHNLAPRQKIVLVGYSLGAGVVLRAGRLKPSPGKIVAVGAPTTRVLFARGGEIWTNHFAARRLRDMEIPPDPQSIEVMERYLTEMDPMTQLVLGELPPVLFIYSELGKNYGVPELRDYLARTDTLNTIHEVPRAPHSYHIAEGPWRLVFYNQQVLESLTTAIAGWTLDWTDKRSRTSDRNQSKSTKRSGQSVKLSLSPEGKRSRVRTYIGQDMGDIGVFAKWSKIEIKFIGPVSTRMSSSAKPFKIAADVAFAGPCGNIYME